MKTFLVTLAALSLALIIGCQENNLNEPDVSFDKRADIDSYNNNTINICCRIYDPYGGSCNVNGCVRYVHEVLTKDDKAAGLFDISLQLEMDSELCNPFGMVHPAWKVTGKSHDIVTVSLEGIALVEKTYNITNRKDVVLLVRYLVTTDGVGISSMMLAEIEG